MSQGAGLLGLVLAGGAARGAYQVGAMRFIFVDLARRLGRPTWPDLVSGTSVGSINGLFAAARWAEALEQLAEMWRGLTVDQVYGLHWKNLFAAARSAYRADERFALLQADALHRLVEDRFPGAALREAIDSGATRALILSATELDTGYNALFVDTSAPTIGWTPAAGAAAHKVRITPRHVLASAALPLLFPPVEVQGRLHLDGGLRQNTPLRPLIRAGVAKALVIGLKQGRVEEGAHPLPDVVPNLPFLLGKTFNAVMLDPVERDIENTRQVNQLISWGVARHGSPFAEDLEAAMGMRHVETLFLRPSEDLGRVASAVWHAASPRLTPQVRWLLGFVADRVNSAESDLLSYLFFDHCYTAVLEDLGYQDAARREEEIVRLLDA